MQDDPFKEIRESIKTLQLTDPFKEIRESMKTLQTLQFNDVFKEIRESMKTLQLTDSFRDTRESFSKMHSSLNIHKNIFQNSIPVNYFENAYQEVILNVIIAKNDRELDESVSIFADEIKESEKNAPKSYLSAEFYTNLIVAFIFFIYSIHLSQESEDRILKKIYNVQQAVTEKLEEVLPEVQRDEHYVVIRPVKMRSKPTVRKNNVINILYPNQTTKLIDRRGKWIKVEYYNYVIGIHESGWCFKKYLKKIK